MEGGQLGRVLTHTLLVCCNLLRDTLALQRRRTDVAQLDRGVFAGILQQLSEVRPAPRGPRVAPSASLLHLTRLS